MKTEAWGRTEHRESIPSCKHTRVLGHVVETEPAWEVGATKEVELKKERKAPKGRPARWTAWTTRENAVLRE